MFNKQLNWLSEYPKHTTGIRILQICIGVMVCIRIATELPFSDYLWGVNGIGYGSTQHILGSTIGGVLDMLYASITGVYFILLIQCIGGFFFIFNIKTRIATLFVLFGAFMLGERLPDINDGGDNITRLVLIYMLFLASHPKKENLHALKIWIHNIGVMSIAMQLIVLYATSGLMKTFGEKWHNGTALYYISNVEWFSLPAFREVFLNPYITTIASYTPMVFMVLFPVAIFSRFKLLWIFIGIFLHLGIGIFMGLISFSLVMIGLELFLINDKEYKMIYLFLQKRLKMFNDLLLQLTRDDG